jgi:hypothetical protein
LPNVCEREAFQHAGGGWRHGLRCTAQAIAASRLGPVRL